jgi:ferritin-like metal-binding protein YciE
MEDLFLPLRDIYYAENQNVKSLPTMIEKSTNRELAKGLREHLRETEGQVARLDKVKTGVRAVFRPITCVGVFCFAKLPRSFISCLV